jgi:hypothetical protein
MATSLSGAIHLIDDSSIGETYVDMCHASGRRIRSLPITVEQLLEARRTP